jgi:hypothetical protein
LSSSLGSLRPCLQAVSRASSAASWARLRRGLTLAWGVPRWAFTWWVH